MKHESYKLTIDDPCKQDWASMSQCGIGKYCSHCSKVVVDFTRLTDNEIVRILKQTPSELCGRLTNQQLNRVYESNQRKSNSRFYKILAGLMLVGATENSTAKDRPTLQAEISPVISSEVLATQHLKQKGKALTDSLKNVVQGKIFDADTKKPLNMAVIMIKGTQTGASADIDGKFKLVIPDKLMKEKIVIQIMQVGYEKTEIAINRNDLPITKDILLILAEGEYYGEVTMGKICGTRTVTKSKKWWQFWK